MEIKHSNPLQAEDDLPAEYDPETLRRMIRNGVRGKYAERLARQGYTATIAPDVAQAFPTDKEVNDALRQLMQERIAIEAA